MSTLVETLNDPIAMRAVISDSANLVESEVAKRGGLSGMALKAGYKTVKAIKPGIIHDALRSLLPEFAPAIDPHFATARESGDVQAYFRRESGPIADALLGVTDARAERAKNRVMKKVYGKLRGQARGQVEQSLPGLADLIERHVPE